MFYNLLPKQVVMIFLFCVFFFSWHSYLMTLILLDSLNVLGDLLSALLEIITVKSS